MEEEINWSVVQPYNAVYFKCLENIFLVLAKELGEDRSLQLLAEIIAKNMGDTYRNMNGRELSGLGEFKRCTSLRYAAVGLRVAFVDRPDGSLVYRFYTDPFPDLKGKIDYHKIDATYIPFTIKYFLGPGWKYETTKHLWLGDGYIEHIIHDHIESCASMSHAGID